ncbi:MAG: MFS transporter, partial [Thaumarchaeota archaeon]|nr:MFS transporter [Nitrososphaerota archaeon]
MVGPALPDSVDIPEDRVGIERRVGQYWVNGARRFGAAIRVFLPSVGSILITETFIGIFLAIVASNVLSNLALTRYEGRLGPKFFLLLFSGLMVASGLLLALTASTLLLLLAFLIGNISTTGTEAGPFQSIETGVLPRAHAMGGINRVFGYYNVLGYGAASLGALAASIPGYANDALTIFRLLYLTYAFVGALLFVLYLGLGDLEGAKTGPAREADQPSPKVDEDMERISLFYSVDSFGGSFVSSHSSRIGSLVYKVSLVDLGVIFFVVNLVTTLSIFGAALIAERVGNLKTMVVTHLVSSVFLSVIPFAGSLTLALLFLFLRQSVSQMDVPTRQAFMAEVFNAQDLVRANSTTNTFRSIGGLFGGPISGVLYATGL